MTIHRCTVRERKGTVRIATVETLIPGGFIHTTNVTLWRGFGGYFRRVVRTCGGRQTTTSQTFRRDLRFGETPAQSRTHNLRLAFISAGVDPGRATRV